MTSRSPLSPEETVRLGQSFLSRADAFRPQTIPQTAPIPTDQTGSTDAVLGALAYIEENYPFLGSRWAMHPEFLPIVPEVAAGDRGTVGSSANMLEALTEMSEGLIAPHAFEDVAGTLTSQSAVVDLFHEYRNVIRGVEKDIISSLMVVLPERRRNRMAALNMAYLRENKIDTEEDRMRWLTWNYQWTTQQMEEHNRGQGILGKVGNFVAQPFRIVSRGATRLWAKVADPDDYSWRQHLSFGQNVAYSVGVDPNDHTAWNMTSGSTDLIANFVLDPINWAFNIGAGAKAAAYIPRATSLSKGSALARAFVPNFTGRSALTGLVDTTGKSLNLPRFSRGFNSRFAWALGSKTIDEIVETPQFLRRVANPIAGIKSASELERLYPVLKNSPELKNMLVDANSPEAVKVAVKYGYTGGGLEWEPAMRLVTEQALGRAKLAYESSRSRMLASGEAGLSSLGPIDRVSREAGVFLAPPTLRAGEVLRRSALSGDDAQKLVLTGDVVIADLSRSAIPPALNKWLNKIGDTTSRVLKTRITRGDLASASDAEISLLRRAGKALEIDLFHLSDETSLLTDIGKSKAIIGKDLKKALPLTERLMPQIADLARTTAAANKVEEKYRHLWVLADIPRGPVTLFGKRPGLFFKGGWRGHASNNADKWWGAKRRMLSAKVFNPAIEYNVDLMSRAAGGRQLATWMREYGVKRKTIDEFVDLFESVPQEMRHDVVSAAIRRVGDETNHPLIKHDLYQTATHGGVRSQNLVNGEELGHLVDDAGERVVPLFPKDLLDRHALPGPEMAQTLRRFRRITNKAGEAKAYKAMPNIRPGLLKSTRDRRNTLVENYQAKVMDAVNRLSKAEGRGEVADQRLLELASLTRQDMAAIAYADVTGQGRPSGLGLIGRAATAINSKYSGFHKIFSISQLAFRPISWSFRVLLEEQFRAAMFDLPNMFKNPKLYLNEAWEAFLSARYANKLKVHSTRIGKLVDDAIREPIDLNKALREADKVFTGKVEDVLAKYGKGVPPTISDLKAAVADIISKESMGAEAKGLHIAASRGSTLRRALSKGAKIKNIREKELRRLGADPVQIQDLVHRDISMRSVVNIYSQEAEAAVLPVEYSPNILPSGLATYGYGLGRSWYRALEDPWIRKFGLARLAAEGASGAVPAGARGQDLVQTRQWMDLGPGIRRLARSKGWEETSDAAIADRYLETILDPYTRYLFKPLWGDDPSEKARVAKELFESRTSKVKLGGSEYVLDWKADNYRGFVNKAGEFVETVHNRNLGHHLPKNLSVYFDPRFAQKGEEGTFPFLRRTTDRLLQTFGESGTMLLSRQPAYRNLRAKWLRHYKGIGMNAEGANLAAHQKAAEMVNYVFYNMEGTPAFLRRMNKVSPFFSAWWEVLQTWAYKIPMESGALVGYPNLVRKVDRLIDAMVHVGLVGIEEDGSTYLNLTPTPDSQNPVGNTLSTMGYGIVQLPGLVLQQATRLKGVIGKGFDPAFDMRTAIKDGFKIPVGSPIDPFSSGPMAVNQAFLGLNPVGTVFAHQGKDLLRGRGPFAVDEKLTDSEPGETLQDIMNRSGVEEGQFLARNRKELKFLLGEELANRVLIGEVSYDQVDIPEGSVFKIPKSSLAQELYNRLLLPFDSIDTPAGAVFAVTPSWLSYVFRGLGVTFAGANQDVLGFEIGGIFGDVAQSQVDSEVLLALQHLEATEGMLSAEQTLAEELKGIELKAAEDLTHGRLVVERDGSIYSLLNPEHPLAEEWQAKFAELKEFRAEIIGRAEDIAGGQLIMRGLLGLFGPSSPRSVFKEQQIAAQFWGSKEWAEAAASRGSKEYPKQLPKVRSPEELNMVLQTVSNFLEDDSGDESKQWLKRNHPTLVPFIQGRSYWEADGEPPEIESIDDYFDQIQSGERKIYRPDVFIQKMQRSGLAMDKEVALRVMYGKDAVQRAVNILNDPKPYYDLLDLFGARYETLDWVDEIFNDGAYTDWRNRARDDSPSLAEELQHRFNEIQDVISQVESYADGLGMSPDERDEFTAILGQGAQYIREQMDQFLDESKRLELKNPMERFLAKYNKQVRAEYWDQISQFTQALDEETGLFEKSLIRAELRDYQNRDFLTQHFVDGVPVPSARQNWWNGLMPEEQEARVLRLMSVPISWISLFDAQVMKEMSPRIGQYIPTTPSDMAVYEEFGRRRNILFEASRQVGDDGQPVLSAARRDREIDALEEGLRDALIGAGRGGEVVWDEAWPIQRLDMAGVLPATLDPYVLQTNTVRQHLESIKKGPRSNVARGLWLQIRQNLLADMSINPALAADYERMGRTLFDKTDFNDIFVSLFYGDLFGSGI